MDKISKRSLSEDERKEYNRIVMEEVFGLQDCHERTLRTRDYKRTVREKKGRST
jgi:hypothetical protein